MQYLLQMIKVTNITQDLLEADNIAFESLRLGLLNLSAYAAKIRPQVEELTKKPVQKGTIVVALSRLADKIGKANYQSPVIKISDLSVKSSLCVLTYEKTVDLLRKIAVLHPFQITTSDIFTVVQGLTEVALVVTQKSRDKIEKQLGVKPLTENEDVVAVTVGFSQELARVPNINNILQSFLSVKKIEVIQAISTFAETTFIINKEDLEKTVQTLNLHFSK